MRGSAFVVAGVRSLGRRLDSGWLGEVEGLSGNGAAESDFDASCGHSAGAARSSSQVSKLFRNLHASSIRSGVCRLITPMVRWSAPTGRIARGGILGSPFASGFETSAAKREREARSGGRDVEVTSGRQRKWVNGGLGGITALVNG